MEIGFYKFKWFYSIYFFFESNLYKMIKCKIKFDRYYSIKLINMYFLKKIVVFNMVFLLCDIYW